jgi:glycogen(starch) synthase
VKKRLPSRERVLMLSWEFPPRIVGGIARHVAELSLALARQGVEVDVLTAHHPGAPREEIIPGGEGRVKVLRAGPSPIHAPDFVYDVHQLDFALLERVLQEGALEYDLIHAHDWLVSFAARTLKQGVGLPLVATMHATEAGRNQGIHTPMQHYIHTMEWMLTYEAWRVVCCSRFMAQEVTGTLRVPRDKVRVVPNGVDPKRVQCGDSGDELELFRSQWAAPAERIVLFVGRLVREKGVEVLIDALPAVVAAHPEAKFVVAGGGDYEGLAARARSNGVEHKVAFTGFLPEADLPRMYKVAEVAVFPSLYEPFGIVALEAMAAGVPVVTSDIGGFREVVRHGQTGLHTWANNADSLAWGLGLVLSDARLAARLRRNGRKQVEEHFGWEAIARQTRAVYAEVLRERERLPEGQAVTSALPGVPPRYLATGEAARRS